MTAPATGRDDATLRGAIVLVVAIVIGLALLARGGGADDSSPTTTRDSAATTEFTGTTGATGDTLAPTSEGATQPSSPTDTRQPGELTVIVLNGTEVVGLASSFAERAEAAGYGVLTSANAATNISLTTVYAPADLSADAAAVAGVLGVPTAPISPKPDTPLGRNGEDADADIVVVLGTDAPQS